MFAQLKLKRLWKLENGDVTLRLKIKRLPVMAENEIARRGQQNILLFQAAHNIAIKKIPHKINLGSGRSVNLNTIKSRALKLQLSCDPKVVAFNGKMTKSSARTPQTNCQVKLWQY